MNTESVIKICQKSFDTYDIEDEDLKQDTYIYAIERCTKYKNANEAFIDIVNFLFDKQQKEIPIYSNKLKDLFNSLDDEYAYLIKAAYGVGLKKELNMHDLTKEFNYDNVKITYTKLDKALNKAREILDLL